MASISIEEASETEQHLDPAAPTSPRISFSSEFLDESNFISISPNRSLDRNRISNAGSTYKKDRDRDWDHQIKFKTTPENTNFEFIPTKNILPDDGTLLTADELFSGGKLLPFWQMQSAAEKQLGEVNLKSNSDGDVGEDDGEAADQIKPPAPPKKGEEAATDQTATAATTTTTTRIGSGKEEPRIWFIDDDPSPRPPKCTVLWKELLRLKKQRAASTLSPSSSSSSTSSSSSSLGDHVAAMDGAGGKEGTSGSGGEQSATMTAKEKHLRRIKKGLERARSTSMRIRPMVNVPICTQGRKSSSLPPVFPSNSKERKASEVKRKLVVN